MLQVYQELLRVANEISLAAESSGSDSSEALASASGEGPAGATTEVQYNDSGAFGASSNFVWDGSYIGFGNSTNLGLWWGSSTYGIRRRTPHGGGPDLEIYGFDRIWLNPGFRLRIVPAGVEWVNGILWDLGTQSMAVQGGRVQFQTTVTNRYIFDGGTNLDTFLRAYDSRSIYFSLSNNLGSGTATNFIKLAGASSTTADREMVTLDPYWVDATDGTRRAGFRLKVWNTAAVEAFHTRVNGSGAAELAFFGATPSARASAYTQSYSTTTKTVAAFTATSVPTDAPTNSSPYGYTEAQAGAIVTTVNNLITESEVNRKLINAIIDDLQAYGLFQ